MSPPPTYPPVLPLNGNTNAFTLVVPFVEMRMVVEMSIAAWDNLFQAERFRNDLTAGLRSLFGSFSSPRCEAYVKTMEPYEVRNRRSNSGP